MTKEIEYLTGKVSEVIYEDNRFTIFFEDGKYLFGVVSPQGENTTQAKLLQYKTIYDTLKDIDYKIKLSFYEAIKYAYSDEVNNNYSVFKESTGKEKLTYYYIENALFRTITLWDMLAQLYRLYYNIEIEIDRVYYNKIFNPNFNLCTAFKDKAEEIFDYINQSNDISIDGEWKGNHKFTIDCRNKMTHRNSPSVATISDYDINLKSHPAFLLKRIIEDYSIVSKFIGTFLYEIESEVMNAYI